MCYIGPTTVRFVEHFRLILHAYQDIQHINFYTLYTNGFYDWLLSKNKSKLAQNVPQS